MRFHRTIPLILIFSFVGYTIQAQESEDYEYTNEFVWGINKNTNGGLIGGFILKKVFEGAKINFIPLGWN